METIKPLTSYLAVSIFDAIASKQKRIYLIADGSLSAYRGHLLGYKLPCKQAISLPELYRLDSWRCTKIHRIIECTNGEIPAMSDTFRICAELAEEWLAANPGRLETMLEKLEAATGRRNKALLDDLNPYRRASKQAKQLNTQKNCPNYD